MKLVFYSSTITVMHGPINIRFTFSSVNKEFQYYKYHPVPCCTVFIKILFLSERKIHSVGNKIINNSLSDKNPISIGTSKNLIQNYTHK